MRIKERSLLLLLLLLRSSYVALEGQSGQGENGEGLALIFSSRCLRNGVSSKELPVPATI